MKVRLMAGMVAAILTIAVTTSQAMAAIVWAQPGADGVVDVCFVSPDLPSEIVPEAEEAASIWNEATSSLDVSMSSCSSSAEVVQMDVEPLGGGVIGRFAFNGSSGRITLDGNQLDSLGIDGWRKTICHEMGHALGLNHVADADSCMKQGNANTLPEQNDFDRLLDFYGGSPKDDNILSSLAQDEPDNELEEPDSEDSGSEENETDVSSQERQSALSQRSGSGGQGQCSGSGCCAGCARRSQTSSESESNAGESDGGNASKVGRISEGGGDAAETGSRRESGDGSESVDNVDGEELRAQIDELKSLLEEEEGTGVEENEFFAIFFESLSRIVDVLEQ